MADDKPYEITVIVNDGKDEVREHVEAKLKHATPKDVVVDVIGVLSSRAPGKVRTIDGER